MGQVEAPDAGSEAAATASTACPRTVRRGSTGYPVNVLQRDLNARGARLTVDSVFGAATQVEVEKWQVRAGLARDGVCGPATWHSLGEC